MPCDTKFETKIDLQCMADIVSDIRNKAPIKTIVRKILWVAGCGLDFITPKDDAHPLMTNHSDEALVNEMESALNIARRAEASATSIHPVVLSVFYQLALRYLAKIQF